MPTRRELLVGLLAAMPVAGRLRSTAVNPASDSDPASRPDMPEGRLACADPAVGAQDIASPTGLAAGGQPLWVLGWMPPSPAPGPPPGGRHATLLWVVEAAYSGPVLASVTAVEDHRPLQLWARGGQPGTLLRLHTPSPAFVPARDRRFLRSASTLFVPSAGCYTVVAESDAGRWQVTFSAGG